MQRRRIRPVDNFLLFLQQIEHVLHVDQRLSDFSINEPEEIQRLIKLQQIGIHQYKVADRHPPLHNALRRHRHHHDQSDGNNGGLSEVDGGKTELVFDGGVFIQAT
ncbi:hypothetical protein D3C87_1902330 [compost metagenome]